MSSKACSKLCHEPSLFGTDAKQYTDLSNFCLKVIGGNSCERIENDKCILYSYSVYVIDRH